MLRRSLASSLVLSLLAGCGSTQSKPNDDPAVVGASDPLRRVANCKELEEALKADLRERLKRSLEEQETNGEGGSAGWGGDGGSGGSGGGNGGNGSGGTAGSGGAAGTGG